MTYNEFKKKNPDTTITEDEYNSIYRDGHGSGQNNGRSGTKADLIDALGAGIEGSENMKISELLTAIKSGMTNREKKLLLDFEEKQKQKTKGKSDSEIELITIKLQQEHQIELAKLKIDNDKVNLESARKLTISNLASKAALHGLSSKTGSHFEGIFEKTYEVKESDTGIVFKNRETGSIVMNGTEIAKDDYVIEEFKGKESWLFETPKQGAGASAADSEQPGEKIPWRDNFKQKKVD